MARRPRLLMADDHTLVLEGIRKLLEEEFELVGTAEDGRTLLSAAEKTRPDVILLDISMPLLNGIETCRQLVRLLPGIPVLFVSMHADAVYVEEAMSAGGAGYLLKRSAASELTAAIRAVLRGDKYVTPLIDWKGPVASASRKDSPRAALGRLTRRQREVLQLIAEGKPNKEIAALLKVSEKTVDFHKSSIKRELMLTSTAALTQFAIRHRMIGL
jgi:DNA-binding NarL/FixJ family response regulator